MRCCFLDVDMTDDDDVEEADGEGDASAADNIIWLPW